MYMSVHLGLVRGVWELSLNPLQCLVLMVPNTFCDRT